MSERILIVDDDEFVRSITQIVLEEAGYSVELADDGLAALAMLEADPSRFDLMLLDKNMPRMDGMALLRRLKSDDRLKELPVIMLTGDTEQQHIAEGLDEGAYYYLIKPSPEDVLKLVVRNALNDCIQKRELRSLVGQQMQSLSLLRRAEFSFRTLQEARNLALWLADASLAPGRTVSGYSEILINAVEHGNLGISYDEKSRLLNDELWASEVESRLQHPEYSGLFVQVLWEKTDSSCIVTVTDQGKGFDWQRYLEFSPERVFDLHGRGIAMSKAMSFDGLEYLGNGNTVVTTVMRQSA